MSERSSLGTHLALAVGIGALAGAGIIAVVGSEPILALILVLVGASALAGWAKARKAG